jgi:hypothetical protein
VRAEMPSLVPRMVGRKIWGDILITSTIRLYNKSQDKETSPANRIQEGIQQERYFQ